MIAPNRFGLDHFDFDDAFGARKDFMCSADLREFIDNNHLDLNQNGRCDLRDIFGSHSDMDHIYNTPRQWFMGRYLAPYSVKWDGENADFGPESDNIPWSLTPDRLVSVEDIIYILSSHYQGTPYDPYANRDTGCRGMYRSIGINRTGVTSICQIRSDVPDAIKGIEWICFGSTTFSSFVPIYACVDQLPNYLSNVSLNVSTDNFYWASRIIGTLVDHSFSKSIQWIDRYHNAVLSKCRRVIFEYDRRFIDSDDLALLTEANTKICRIAKEETDRAMSSILAVSSEDMKNGYNRADN